MVNKEQYINWLLNVIAGKLLAHGVNIDNYSKNYAIRILENCVAPTMLVDCLDENELALKDVLRLACVFPECTCIDHSCEGIGWIKKNKSNDPESIQ